LLLLSLKNILSILSVFCDTERENLEIILRKYDEKYTLFLTPISVLPIMCPLWKTFSHIRVFSGVSDVYSNTFLQKRLGMTDFERIDISQEYSQTIIVPTDIGKNNFQQKINFLSTLLEHYPGKLCIVTASKVESQSVFLALLEQKEEKNRKIYAQGVSGGQQKVFFEFTRAS